MTAYVSSLIAFLQQCPFAIAGYVVLQVFATMSISDPSAVWYNFGALLIYTMYSCHLWQQRSPVFRIEPFMSAPSLRTPVVPLQPIPIINYNSVRLHIY